MWCGWGLVKAAAFTGRPSVRYWSRPWLDASNAAWVTPSAARPDMFDRKVTMSGVVSPVEALASDVVMPSVPIEAALKPAIRHSWRVLSTVEGLPFVPVTADPGARRGKRPGGK